MHSIVKKVLVLALLIINSVLLELNAQTPETDSLENLLQKHLEKDTIRVNLLNKTAFNFRSINPEKLLKYAEEAGELATQTDFAKGKAESLRIIGIYYRNKSDYPKALEYYQKSLKIREELGDEKGISSNYNNIGVIYSNQGDYPKALEYYQKSLKIREELGDKKGISRNYNNIGVIYSNRGDYPKALEYYQKSLKIREELGDKRGVSSNYNNIGLIYNNQGDYAKALKSYKESLKIGEELGYKKGISRNYNNIGLVYSNQRDYAKALEYYQKSLKISIEIGIKSLEAYNYQKIGSLYLKQKKTKEAYNYSKKAFLLAEEIGNPELLKESSKKLAKSCEALGLYKEAYGYYVVFKTMNDSLLNEENIKTITGLEYKYKYEKEKALLREREHLTNIKLKNEKYINYFLYVILIIMLAFVVFIIINKRKSTRFYKNELRLNKKIKESEIKLLISNKKLLEEQSIFIIGNVIVFKWQNKEGWPVEYVSQNVSNVFGYTSNNFLSGEVDYANLIHKDDLKTVNEEINYSIANNLNHFTHNEYRIKNKAGEEIWLYDFTTIIRNSANEITHFYGYVMNVTDRKKAEQALVIAKHKLNEELARSKRDLVSTAIELSSISEVIINSLKTINKLLKKHSTKNISEDLLNVKKVLEYQLKKQDIWELFKMRFQQVHPSFFIKLGTKHPSLSKSELKFCAYLRVNLSSYQIATVLNISKEGIRKSRYRIRTKMELDLKDSLEDYISKF